MPGRFALRSLTLVCAALAAGRLSAQNEVADLHEDVQGLTQRLGELTLRVEQLEQENAALRTKVAGIDGARDLVTTAQLNGAVADLNASIKSAVGSSRTEILQQVATQMEKLAKQTNAALDSIAKPATPVQARPAQQGDAPKVSGESFSKEGVSYTVQKGDSVGLIAKKTGAKSQDIIDANKLSDPSRIQPGQVLFVPGGK
ncbi:MAG TPA: LysM peptidoglycan-binding domain-containing protein [Opitutaceae bacterium]